METVRKDPQAHLDGKQWRSTPLVHRNEFHALVEGMHTTGERGYRVSSTSDKLEARPVSTKDLKDADNNSEPKAFRRIVFPQ